MKAASLPPKPLSIMRRTAIGTVSMASAETTSASMASASRAGCLSRYGFNASSGCNGARFLASASATGAAAVFVDAACSR